MSRRKSSEATASAATPLLAPIGTSGVGASAATADGSPTADSSEGGVSMRARPGKGREHGGGDAKTPLLPRAGDEVDVKHRLLDRNSVFHQSYGKFSITRQGGVFQLYMKDLFHSLLHVSTPKLMVLIFVMYLLAFLFFAVALYAFELNRCHTAFDSFMDTYMFAVETMITIGYSTPDIFFEQCFSMAVWVTLMSVVGCMLDAVCIGILYDRISRANSRANTIIFSRFATLTFEGGRLQFRFRVVELRKHQMVEAHVRAYAIRHHRRRPGGPMLHYQSRELRIHDPNDEIGGMALLVVPFEVTSRLDDGFHSEFPRSPLMPPVDYMTNTTALFERLQAMVEDGKRAAEGAAKPAVDPDDAHRSGNLGAPGSSGGEDGDGSGEISTINSHLVGDHPAGTDDGFYDMWAPGYSIPPCRRDAELLAAFGRLPAEEQWRYVAQYWRDVQMEVIVLVEGIDAVTSDTCQARHSYTLHDVYYNHDFEPCVDADAVIDLNKFHDVYPITTQRRETTAM